MEKKYADTNDVIVDLNMARDALEVVYCVLSDLYKTNIDDCGWKMYDRCFSIILMAGERTERVIAGLSFAPALDLWKAEAEK
jgi:hypothetical protein